MLYMFLFNILLRGIITFLHMSYNSNQLTGFILAELGILNSLLHMLLYNN